MLAKTLSRPRTFAVDRSRARKKADMRRQKGEGQMDGKGQECIRKMSEMAVC